MKFIADKSSQTKKSLVKYECERWDLLIDVLSVLVQEKRFPFVIRLSVLRSLMSKQAHVTRKI